MNVQLCTSPVQICTPNTPVRTEYIVVDRSNLNLIFKKVGCAYSRTLELADLELVDHERENFRELDPKDRKNSCITKIIEWYAEDAIKISQRLGIKIEGSGTECLRSFKVQVGKLRLDQTTILDLCNLGLHTLPCIEVFNRVGRINLSGNNIVELGPLLGLNNKVIDFGNDAYSLTEKFHNIRRKGNITLLPLDGKTQTFEWRQREINLLQ